MDVISEVKKMQSWADRVRSRGERIGLVPTMGYLHEGHLSLVREGRRRTDHLVLSIFVNPTQFGPGEDLAAYPRNMAGDRALAEKNGVDVLFAPTEHDLYGPDYQTFVSLERLPHHLCGLSRPVHFRGVATVVAKLFNIVKPHVAVFGEKDYQQLMVIRRMAADLNFDVKIVGAPTVREEDGLAKSSRNAYLVPEQRESALTLSRSLEQAEAKVGAGETDPARLTALARDLIAAAPDTRIDYIEICDPRTLERVDAIEGPVLMALAVHVGQSRLIDNRLLIPGKS
jgi:pantoate--beta-alanine ligase